MKTFKFLCITTLFTVLIGCSKEIDSLDKGPIKVNSLEGRVEKGPFTQGATVTIQELSQELFLTGKSFQTDIFNNEGNFKLETAIEFISPYIQIACDGYFFNEVTGQLSNSQIRLESFVDIRNKRNINVNILTHLSKNRIMKLMNEGKAYEDATLQAREELLTCFGLQEYKEFDFEDLSISSGEKEAGVLIIISSILLANRTEAELTEYVSTLKESFTSNGTLPENIIKTLTESSKQLKTKDITSNIIKRYDDLGKEISVPDLRYYIDWDGDGIAGNELGDPNIERYLFFDVDTVYVGKEGGVFNINIQTNIPFTTELYNVPIEYTVMNILDKIELTKTINENEIIINVSPTIEPFLSPRIISIYSYDGRLKADLCVVQDGSFSNELSNELIHAILSEAASAFDYTHTIEALYTNSSTSSINEWQIFTLHNLSSEDNIIYNTWNSLYQLNYYLNMIQYFAGDNSSRYFTSLRALLYYHLTILWGDVPYDVVFSGTYYQTPRTQRTPVSTIYSSLQQQLEECISGMREEDNESFFDVSKNVPRALLAKILIQQNKYAEALVLLKEIISSGVYTLNINRNERFNAASTEMIYAINKEIFPTPNHTNIIQTSKYLPLVQYSEIILLASECEYKTGNTTTAINYLNQIRNRDGVIPATSETYNTDLKETWKTTMMGGFSYFSFLKRNGLIASELNIQDYQKLFPIPSSELMANSLMTQNPGYE